MIVLHPTIAYQASFRPVFNSGGIMAAAAELVYTDTHGISWYLFYLVVIVFWVRRGRLAFAYYLSS